MGGTERWILDSKAPRGIALLLEGFGISTCSSVLAQLEAGCWDAKICRFETKLVAIACVAIED